MLTEKIDLLREALRYVRAKHRFTLDAIVVLPDHLREVWTLPSGNVDNATRWRLIKTMFSRGVPVSEGRSISREGKAERGVWQRRYWEHTLRDENDFERHCDYIHINPVKHDMSRQCATGRIRHIQVRETRGLSDRLGRF